MELLGIAGFGALGTLFRYFSQIGIARFFARGDAFWATLAVNILGSLAIGILLGLQAQTSGGSLSPSWERALRIGFLGGFTTFSAFSGESLLLFQAGRVGWASAYLILSPLLGLGAAALGYRWMSLG